uniref:CMP-N-acetylneuraminate-beta-galactosamide- alpha-2,3-sialyltransferase 4 isoform X2 n=1 Tax=Monopterus albus TaxID=43700 RepID=UPI0009B40E30|nr:CMP-N-acetylneuraminate-beta-galactosamide-alpha-2,3-sialyltransferase 4 isoform X2 [Monopterus albus]
MTNEHVKMSQKPNKKWYLRCLPVLVLLLLSSVIYYLFYDRLLSISRQTKLFLKMEDFFWREPTSKFALPYGTKGSELMLLKILSKTTNYQMPANIEGLQCKTCAVIGNGFTIKNSSLGSTINNYDVVIRMNGAPVRGYEDDVGNKTTMTLFYPESASHDTVQQMEPSALVVLVPFKQQDLRWLKEILYNEKRNMKGFWKPPPQIWSADDSNIRVLDPHFLQQTADRLLHIPLDFTKQESVHPTMGILAVFVALNYCDVVHVAGFGYPQSNNPNDPIHYYEDVHTMKSMKNSHHDLKREAATLKRLKDSGAILYLHPHL